MDAKQFITLIFCKIVMRVGQRYANLMLGRGNSPVDSFTNHVLSTQRGLPTEIVKRPLPLFVRI